MCKQKHTGLTRDSHVPGWSATHTLNTLTNIRNFNIRHHSTWHLPLETSPEIGKYFRWTHVPRIEGYPMSHISAPHLCQKCLELTIHLLTQLGRKIYIYISYNLILVSIGLAFRFHSGTIGDLAFMFGVSQISATFANRTMTQAQGMTRTYVWLFAHVHLSPALDGTKEKHGKATKHRSRVSLRISCFQEKWIFGRRQLKYA